MIHLLLKRIYRHNLNLFEIRELILNKLFRNLQKHLFLDWKMFEIKP